MWSNSKGMTGPSPTHFDLTVAESLGKEQVPPVDREHTEQDAGQERRQQLSESDTESVRRIRRRRFVLQFEPDSAPQSEGPERGPTCR